jgi:hypothetical protein
MPRLRISYLVSAALVLIPARGALAQSSPSDPYKIILVTGPGSYWGYVRPKTPLADIIDSEGQYLISKQQARSLNEKVRQDKIVTRKKEIEFWVWRRDFLAQAEEKERERIKQREILRAVDEPPRTEIYAGISLTILLKQLQKLSPLKGPSSGIDAECLRHIHIRSEADHGLGLLSQDSIFWPPLLATERKDQCVQLEQMLNQVKQQVGTSRGVDQQFLLDIGRKLDSLRAWIDAGDRANNNSRDVIWNPDYTISARRLLRQIKESVATLQNNPEAVVYLRPLQAQTVSELVEYMKNKGLVFGEALAGDERHYVALHRALATELGRVRPSQPALK